MKRSVLFAVVLAAVALAGLAVAFRPAGPAAASTPQMAVDGPAASAGINWVDITEAYKLAKTPGNAKYVFVHVTTNWCGWCRKMERETYTNAQVSAYMNQRFINVSLDAERKDSFTLGGRTYVHKPGGRNGIHEFAQELLKGQMSYPTIVLLTPDFQIIQPLPGYQDAYELLKILKYIGDETYKTTAWEAYSASYDKANKGQ